MVKGVSRRVILVKSPDPKLFEQAIFIVREDALQGSGITAEKVLEEARQVANRYVLRNSRWGRGLGKVPPAAWLAVGAVLASTLWGLAAMLGV
jgi:hypothetical protein